MGTFVLVHGGWHGGWAWNQVTPFLKSANHDVFAPTLPGLAERADELTREINLESHVNAVIQCIEANNLHDIVLCGHSYGGMVVTSVADRLTTRIAALVLVDAALPRDGTSMFDLLEEDRRQLLIDSAKSLGDGWKVPPPPAVAWDVDIEQDRSYIDARTTMHPLAAMEQAARLSGAWKAIRKKVYVVAERYHRPTFKRTAENDLQDSGQWTRHSFNCGHEVMIEKPKELAEILLVSSAGQCELLT